MTARTRRVPFGDAIRRAAHWPLREWLTMVHVALVVSVVEALIRWVPVDRLGRLMGVRLSFRPVAANITPLTPDDMSPDAVRTLRCTRRVTRRWPFCSGPCLRSALVGAHLLRDLQPSVRIGLTVAGDAVSAHAWIEIDGRPIEEISAYSAFQERA